ncbi:hypothetical protein HYS30_00495, partial [Candidatus Peregrinibacteria bacterium]|nr:hypothetical protein [Candidatus Peregrinibacteria bacterium]
TTEDWNILLTRWDPSKHLELTISHTHPANHARVAVSDLLARYGPFRLEGDASSIVVRGRKNRDPDGYSSTVRMTSGQALRTSSALSGAVMIEFFYD